MLSHLIQRYFEHKLGRQRSHQDTRTIVFLPYHSNATLVCRTLTLLIALRLIVSDNVTMSQVNGSLPQSDLIMVDDRSLYGSTIQGGIQNGGLLFRLDPDNGRFEVIHSFGVSDRPYVNKGFLPRALLRQQDGTLYGTTERGGAADSGVVYRINSDGSGFSILHVFNKMNKRRDHEGANPSNALILGKDGALYGLTIFGGAHKAGTIFRLEGDGTRYRVVHSFEALDNHAINHNGSYPSALLMCNDGLLYGTTRVGGRYGSGIIFRVKPDGSHFDVLHNFHRAGWANDLLVNIDGVRPTGRLVQDHNGTLYGATAYGGMYGNGTIFKIRSDGNGFVVVHSFCRAQRIRRYAYAYCNREGANPIGGLYMNPRGILYGTASHGGNYGNGTIFSLQNDGHQFKVLHTFASYTNAGSGIMHNLDGSCPVNTLIQGVNGVLYGTSTSGGSHDYGTIYRLQADGSKYKVLFTF